MKIVRMLTLLVSFFLFQSVVYLPEVSAATETSYNSLPPFVASGAPPLVMLVMGRNHKLYYEAYNDASDLNDDDVIDSRYKPVEIDYYGYFDNFKCYEYDTADKRFEPSSVSSTKTCSGSDEWSGDFLNYLTMSRMDTMRKVLYGGYRKTDSSSSTVLERVYIPQDAHSWGKEYTSPAVDGYDIADYTPFSTPVSGLRHLFASTNLDSDRSIPLLRYVLNNPKRIWNWVAKEDPVVDNSIETSATGHPGHPTDHEDFEDMVIDYATSDHLDNTIITDTYTNVDGGGDYGSNYLAIFTGTLNVATAGDYKVAVDGDDAIEVIIDGGTANEKVIGRWGNHARCNCYSYFDTVPLAAGEHTFEFRMEEGSGSDYFHLYWNGPDSGYSWEAIPAADTTSPAISGISDFAYNTYSLSLPASTIVDRVVRVEVCNPSVGLETNCKQYPDGNYKPIGILQRHGEANRMYFGLMSGSYENNTKGGVLRKQVGTITDEILTSTTGQFNTSVNGIVQTINKFKITDWGGSSYSDCGWITTGPLTSTSRKCRDWGNPMAEMMYETVRYFAGKGGATSNYSYSSTARDNTLGLPLASFNNPYDLSAGGYSSCAKPFMLVLSDINPTFDSDDLPGVASEFGGGISGDLGGFNAESLANEISTVEGISGRKYIGQSGSDSDGACTEKTVSEFGETRGLCPEEPTKGGSYYAAAVARYGHETDLQTTVNDDQKVTTFAVGLASPLPKIKFNLADNVITLVPFAKTVGNRGDSQVWNYWPTNTLVDFFVETLSDTYGKFRINYEDVEQGADHDMDNIVVYEYQLVDASGVAVSDPADAKAVQISLETTYASGGYIQHSGYIISGTTKDGTYLEITDNDTSASQDFLVVLDTPPGDNPIENATDVTPSRDVPGGTHNSSLGTLPKSTTRTFYPNTSGAVAAELLENPLWYAAKYGGYEESDKDTEPGYGYPDKVEEWDKDGDGNPDTYFYVSNPLKLEQQLNAAFGKVLEQASSGTAASVISNSRSGEGALYQSIFYPNKVDGSSGDTITWAGQVHALLMDDYGNMREDTDTDQHLDLADDYVIQFVESGSDIKVERYKDVNSDQIIDGADTLIDIVDPEDLAYLWNSSDWLNSNALDSTIAEQRSTYLDIDSKRYIFTWADADADQIVDSGEVLDFVWPSSSPGLAALSDTNNFYPYLHLFNSFADTPSSISSLSTADYSAFLLAQTERQINYIRGKDYLNSGSPVPLNVSGSDISGTELRSRQFKGKTWRLGDITYSTPTVVARPAENFHLLYGDQSYSDFVLKYKHRRQMVYAGANDGMMHAFNGGFYDDSESAFCTAYPCADVDPDDPPLGAEMWAYVPYNLLPHLYWLTQTTYDEHKHVYYVDQKPRIFDAKIFEEESACSTLTSSSCVHPGGWGTVMVVGMRLGGGTITADIDKTDGATTAEAEDREMKSAYMIFDITDPENPPKLMAEISMPNMGFSTVYPTAFAFKDGDHDGVLEDYDNTTPSSGENRWFLVLGSGPADSSGKPGSISAVTGVYDSTVLADVKSQQAAHLYLLDLVKLGKNNELYSLNSTGALVSGLQTYATYDTNAFLGDPVAVDFELDFNADTLYFGTVSGDVGAWGGNLHRVVLDDQNDGDDDNDPTKWTSDKLLMEVTQPIVSGPAVGIDDDGRHWVFCGTGRFYTAADKVNVDQQSFYGVKEPLNGSSQKNWDKVELSNLLNMTNTTVKEDKTLVSSVISASAAADGDASLNWNDLIAQQYSEGGWYLNFSSGERNIGQATLYGGLLTFTSFKPTADICEAGGTSSLWALYYKTGTAHYSAVLGTDGSGQALTNMSLGSGLATSPSIQTGRSEGSNVYVQSSTGKITKIEQENPLTTKSGLRSWRVEDE